MSDNISARELLNLIVRKKRVFLWVTVVSAIVGAIIVLLIPKQYQSVAIVFSARQFTLSKLVVEPNAGNQEDYMVLGDGDDTEKLMQVLVSDKLKVLVADKLDLWKRWKIKEPYAFHYLRLKWEDMVAIRRTEYNSIRIEAHDYTANGAAQVANTVMAYADTVKNQMNRAVAGQVLKIVKEEYENTLARMKVLEDSLHVLRNMGILHFKEQVKAYSKQHAKAILKGDQAAAARLKQKLDTLGKYGTAYTNTKDNLDKYGVKYPDIRQKYDDALLNYNSYIPLKFEVEKGIPNEYKSRPKRTLMLIVIILATNVFALFWLLVKDKMARNALLKA